MTIQIELDEDGEDGQVRVRVDREGERAVSDLIDPRELINKVLDAVLPKEETSA